MSSVCRPIIASKKANTTSDKPRTTAEKGGRILSEVAVVIFIAAAVPRHPGPESFGVTPFVDEEPTVERQNLHEEGPKPPHR